MGEPNAARLLHVLVMLRLLGVATASASAPRVFAAVRLFDFDLHATDDRLYVYLVGLGA